MENEKLHYRNGAVVLYKRGRSKKWQARLKIGSGAKGWKRVATGECSIEKAAQIAVERFDEHKYRLKYNLSPDSRTFYHCADISIKEMELALETGGGKVIYNHYIGALKKYLIPFFDKRHIDRIDYQSLVDFKNYRINKMGCEPARSTINTHNAALNRVFNVALKNNWIREGSIPSILNDGNTPSKKVRPYFNDDEYHKLLNYLKNWGRTGRKEITRQIRTLLYDYVIILANTGMRTGTEADYLKWNDITEFIDPKTNQTFLKFMVNGKTGQRELVADNNVKDALNRIIRRHPVFEIYDSTQPFAVDAHVFSLPCNGQLPKDLGRAFKKCLKECNLLSASDGTQRTLYSLRHSYATKMLIHGDVKIYDLALQMGTSVAMIEKHYGHVRASQLATKLNLSKHDDSLRVGIMDRDQTVNFLKSISQAREKTQPKS
jgi:integrase